MTDWKKKSEAALEEASQADQLRVKLQRKAEKLRAVASNPALQDEPDVGTVLKFSTRLPGGTKLYTFVAYRADTTSNGWFLTGRKNSLAPLRLNEDGNSWDELALAIGSSGVEFASKWSGAPTWATESREDPYKYDYYQGAFSRGFYRILKGQTMGRPEKFIVRYGNSRWESWPSALEDLNVTLVAPDQLPEGAL